ncbi:MAG: UDP-N-acetylmuramoyl-tripeptide--D-alanyl-D-alanine ligase [Alphaproteobacteria bacterium MarineAlpha6_Bin4]|nr:MAG: UDP-N-acetylmuramoyl-tripeptide--D-alanyl-D-alanine ligase [Alphaproteobacteria bacterium MarineAlpha6_Bin3]PPR38465.1 MAG: UDP-N-acetylmuramoyl-tripeptide--D-alanyl-D-alanine ligase [Alphaproteobacteria bacterium MarineAlpha6_Bin4]|tara:strand:+ start:11971 stop:13365 length:1395 start_codon:yes stop_codon:yes gene_type:complete
MKQRTWSQSQIEKSLKIRHKIIRPINGISINSKTTKKNNLFLPLKGKNYDGHEFISEAFKKGASLSLANINGYQKFKLKKFKKKIVLVKNVVSSLHKLAIYSRKEINGNVVAITGSVGKTSVKEALSFILKKNNKIQSSIGNFNNLIGMPINLANFNNISDINILELGMNQKGEIKKMSNICKPNISLITKISNAHIGNFNSLKDIARAKSEIFYGMDNSGIAIINQNDPYYSYLIKILKSLKIKKVITFGTSKGCDVKLIKSDYKNKSSCKVFIDVLGKKIDYYLNNLGDHWIENSLAIASTIAALNKDLGTYIKKISQFNAIKGRGEIINIKYKNKKITLIDDTYNSSPESLKASITHLSRLGKKRKKICVLGDMFELGKLSKKFHLKIKKILKDNKISNVYTIGNEMKNLFNSLPKSYEAKHSDNLQDLYLNLKENIKKDDIILFKASRAINLDKIIKRLC